MAKRLVCYLFIYTWNYYKFVVIFDGKPVTFTKLMEILI